MADSSWLEIFSAYSDSELLTKLDELKQSVSAFASQNAGNKGFTTDLNALKEQLSSATRIAVERGLKVATRPKGNRVFVTDFSNRG